MNIAATLPDRLAERARNAARSYEAEIAKARASHAAAIAHIIEYGKALREGRNERASDKMFGRWVIASGLDQVKPFDEQQERTAAMKIAEISTQGTFPLGKCPRSRPTDVMSWWRAQQRDKNVKVAGRQMARKAPVKDHVKEIARAYKAEHGDYPTREQLDEAVGSKVYHSTSSQAIGELRAEEEAQLKEAAEREMAVQEAVDAKTVKFTKAQQHHLDAALKRQTKQLDAAFHETVRQQVLKGNATYRATLDELQKKAGEEFVRYHDLINRYEAIFTEAEFHNIRNCLHPDNSASADKRQLAFTTFNIKKLQLTGKR